MEFQNTKNKEKIVRNFQKKKKKIPQSSKNQILIGNDGCQNKKTKERNKYCVISCTCGVYKNGTDELICKAESHRYREPTHGYQAGKEEGDELGDWD